MSKNEPEKDHTLSLLLDLDGVSFFVDHTESWWVKFEVRRVPPTGERPRGISYAITLHGPSGKRVFGYDNAHPTQATGGPGGKKTRSQDHVHRDDTIRPYKFKDAATLLADFWTNVDRILDSKGVKK